MALYVLLNSFDEVVDEIDSITPGGAEYYFMKRKLGYFLAVDTL